jgi:hypothetical protein
LYFFEHEDFREVDGSWRGAVAGGGDVADGRFSGGAAGIFLLAGGALRATVQEQPSCYLAIVSHATLN